MKSKTNNNKYFICLKAMGFHDILGLVGDIHYQMFSR
jgi:hypothetical protein